MLAAVDACDCTRGLYGHRKKVCTGSRLWQKNPPQWGVSKQNVELVSFCFLFFIFSRYHLGKIFLLLENAI